MDRNTPFLRRQRAKTTPAGRAPIARRWILALLLAMLAPLAPAAGAQAGFTDELVVGGLGQPTALAFTPDGRLLIADKPGRLLVRQPSATAATVALDISGKVCSGQTERGLLGVAVDPAFTRAGGFVYLYYTFEKDPSCPTRTETGTPVNRVSRFQMTGDVAAADSERILIDNISSFGGNHNGGDVQIGKDGHLYATVGDASVSTDAPKLNTLNGKILRVRRDDGGIPADNPYRGAGTRPCRKTGGTEAGMACQEIFARGLRNPFRFAFDPDAKGTRFFINDVGAGTWEEVDAGKAKANYGWPNQEGPCPSGETTGCAGTPRGLTDPIDAYKHATGCESITGGAFVPDGAGFPAAFGDDYLFADFVCGTIFRLSPVGQGRFDRSAFRAAVGRPVHLTFGPADDGDGLALYYATFTEQGGQVRRLAPQ